MRWTTESRQRARTLRAEFDRLIAAGASGFEACDRLASSWPNGSRESVWYIVSVVGPTVVCPECWKVSKRYGNTHRCQLHYRTMVRTSNLRAWKKRVEAKKPDALRRASRFMTNDELYVHCRRTYGMSREQFGEALADVTVRPTYPHHDGR